MPDRVNVRVAYKVRRGNAFKKYLPFDFDLQKSPICVTSVGARYQTEGNQLRVAPEDSTFIVEVTGFDLKRDLAIKIDPKFNEGEDAADVQLHWEEEDSSPVGEDHTHRRETGAARL